jgi:hypothetical protein
MALSMNISWTERLIWLASAALNEAAALAHLIGAIKPPAFNEKNVSEWMTLEPRGNSVLLAFFPFLEGYAAFNCRDPLFHQLLSGLVALGDLYVAGLRIWAFRRGYIPLRGPDMLTVGVVLFEVSGLAYIFAKAARRRKAKKSQA